MIRVFQLFCKLNFQIVSDFVLSMQRQQRIMLTTNMTSHLGNMSTVSVDGNIEIAPLK
mgnify:CR=1 FL=1